MGSLHGIDATTHTSQQPPRHLKDFWSIIIDTGAAVSVCPMTFCEHIAVKTMPESARRQYVTVTGEDLTIEGWKEVTLVIGAITMQIRFIAANVQSALLGLPGIDDNNVTVHTGKKPHIEKNGLVEQLHSLAAHLHAAAMVLPGFHKPNETKLDNSISSRYNPSKRTTLIVGEVEDISQQANSPKQLRQPPQTTKQEQEQHRITPICHTSHGAQFESKPKDNQFIIDLEV
eukprot:5934034-Amphidinium_carterae.2